MSWRIAVRHRTGYQYAAPARASYNEVRMTPATAGGQHLLTTRLDIRPDVPPAALRRLLGHPGARLRRARAAHRAGGDRDLGGGDRPARRPRRRRLGHAVRGGGPGPVRRAAGPVTYAVAEDELDAVARSLRAAGRRPRPAGRRSHWVHETLDYVRGATSVGTTSAEARRPGQGRLPGLLAPRAGAAALGRAAGPVRLGLPAPGPETRRWTSRCRRRATPGWSSGPATGSRSTRPTSSEVAERHVLVARGRDYADVRPLAGVYSGPAAQSLGVTRGADPAALVPVGALSWRSLARRPRRRHRTGPA